VMGIGILGSGKHRLHCWSWMHLLIGVLWVITQYSEHKCSKSYIDCMTESRPGFLFIFSLLCSLTFSR
jgi:hypothetical protein